MLLLLFTVTAECFRLPMRYFVFNPCRVLQTLLGSKIEAKYRIMGGVGKMSE